MKAVCYGAILWDLIDGEAYLGGSCCNLAAHLVQCGADACMISCVGDDELGRRAIREMQQLTIDTAFVQTDSEHLTGTVDVLVAADGQP